MLAARTNNLDSESPDTRISVIASLIGYPLPITLSPDLLNRRRTKGKRSGYRLIYHLKKPGAVLVISSLLSYTPACP